LARCSSPAIFGSFASSTARAISTASVRTDSAIECLRPGRSCCFTESHGRPGVHRALGGIFTGARAAWAAKVKQENCNVEKTTPIYEDMIAKLRSDAQGLGAWLTLPPPMGTPAPPQSGQTAPLNASGLAGAVAANNPMEVETFINRVVTSLGCNIVDQRGFTEFVRTWSTTTRNANCDVSRVKSIYDEMVVKIRNDAQVPGRWVGMNRSAAASASPQSGQTAPLNASGLAGAVAMNSPTETETFIGRVVVSMGCRVMDYNKLRELSGQWSAMTREKNCEVSQVEPIYRDIMLRISRDAASIGGWVSMQNQSAGLSGGLGGRAAPQSGNNASLDERGLAAVCASDKPQDMECFIGRLCVSKGFHVKTYPTLSQLASTWAAQVREQNCDPSKVRHIFDDICQRVQRDAQIPGGWIAAAGGRSVSPLAPSAPLGSSSSASATPPPPMAPLGGSRPAAPLSGQSAPLNAAGFAGVCASGKPMDVQAFVGRLLYDLGCKTAPGQYSAQSRLCEQWAQQAKQQNCVEDRVKPIFDEMVSKIRGDSQLPGSWVMSSKPAGSSTPPAPLGRSAASPLAPVGASGVGTPPAPLAPVGASGLRTPPAPMAPVGASGLATPTPPLAPQPLAPVGALGASTPPAPLGLAPVGAPMVAPLAPLAPAGGPLAPLR